MAIKFSLMPTQTECDHFKCRRWNLVYAGSRSLNKQSKLFKFQIHNPVRATVVPITHDKLKSVNWSHCCYMLITLAGKHAPLRTSQIAYFIEGCPMRCLCFIQG